MRRPGVNLVAAVALLLTAAAPVFDFHTGFAGTRTFPAGSRPSKGSPRSSRSSAPAP